MALRSHITKVMKDERRVLPNTPSTKKSIDAMIAESELPHFRLTRPLGPWSMIAIGVGAIIGSGIYSLAGIAAGGIHYPIPRLWDNRLAK